MLRESNYPALTADRLHQLIVDSRGPYCGEELSRLDIERRARDESPLLGGAKLDGLVDAVEAKIRGLGCLEHLFEDPDVSEIMVNGPDLVWIERRGRLQRVHLDNVLDAHAIEQLIERVVSPLGLRIDRSSPLVDARLPDGSRVNAVVPPLAVDGPCMTIRRFGARQIPLSDFCHPEVEQLLVWAVRARRNIIISGGTGAGKTTLLNALALHIDDDERVVTVEETAELKLQSRHVVRLEARPPNAEGAGEVTLRDLVRNALRMRPDRIVVGEVRGPEALDMLQAMNTGHDGSLSTCHANGALDALRRIETMVLTGAVALPLYAIREQMAAGLDLVIQLARQTGGARSVVEVSEVCEEFSASNSPKVRRLAGRGGLEAPPQRKSRFDNDCHFEFRP